MSARYTCIWAFQVSEENRSAFEACYAPDGAWGSLFRQQAGFIGMQLLRDRRSPGRYLTVDRWMSEAAYDAFRSTCAEAYAELDRQCEGLALEERFIGGFLEPGP
ncbi:MAG: antibiotic biosynthesis monooxygenase [Xanthomonadales bacterium]|nr:antibiotic biosynthesis monooxygenase [Xanthomonadales bacterium]